MPQKSLIIKIAIAVAIVFAVLLITLAMSPSRTSTPMIASPTPSLIPASEGFEGDGLPEYRDVEYYMGHDEES